MQMEISTKVTGRMERLMAMESLLILKVQCTKDNGEMINNMVWEQKLGTKDKLDILDNFQKEKKPVGEDLSLMEAIMMETLLMESSMVKENTISLIQVKFMKVISKITTCMDKVSWYGQTNLDTTENFKMGKWQVMVSNNTQKVIDT
tara:strand:+ start:590 stop:1030 length:441 start_codon:yes stop_codon:yes gene_type:complete